jgi:pathogenesis-related protein 1
MGVVRSSVLRIGWAAAAAVVTMGLVPGLAVAAPGDTGSNISPAERDEILAQHNLYRAEVGQPPLAWDDTIAAGAQQWADAKQADGRFEHSDTNLGENLAGGEVKDATIRLATGVGVTPPDDERASYQTDPQPTGQEKKKVGHYTQIVWSSTTKLGCGFAPANQLAFGLVVCRYSPPGNFRGQFPYPPDTVLVPQPGLAPVNAPAGGTPPGGTPDVATQADGTQAGEPPPVQPTPEAGGSVACSNTDASGLSPSATEESLSCLITSARISAGLRGLTASPLLRTVAASIAQGTNPPDVPAALTEAGYCPGGRITSWSYASFAGGSPKAAFDYFASNAHDIVLGPGGDLGVGAAGSTVTLMLAQCG